MHDFLPEMQKIMHFLFLGCNISVSLLPQYLLRRAVIINPGDSIFKPLA